MRLLQVRKKMLKKILSNNTCAKCKICCSFVKSDAWESPIFSQDEMKELVAHGISQEKFKELNINGKDVYMADYEFVSDTEILLCPCLDQSKGCVLGEKKPFECSIWPIRIFQNENGQYYLGLAEVCAAFEGEKRDLLIYELNEGGLRDQILQMKDKQNIIKNEEDGYAKV